MFWWRQAPKDLGPIIEEKRLFDSQNISRLESVLSRFFNMPAYVGASINERLGAVSRLMSHAGADISETPGPFLGFIGSLAPPHR